VLVVFALAVLAVVLVLVVVLRGAPELARLSLHNGKLSLRRGRMPPRLFDDFRDVLATRPIARADIRVVLDGGRPRVVATGLSEDELQQLRNVTGSYTTAQFRAGRPRM
jgi:hypothetical protein